jgi:hypothetical protein
MAAAAAAVAIAAAVGKPSALVLKPLPAEGFFIVGGHPSHSLHCDGSGASWLDGDGLE